MARAFGTENEKMVQSMLTIFLDCPIGEMVGKAEQQRVCGANAYLIQAAKRRANEEAGANFKAVRGLGYQRLPDDEAHAVGLQALRAIRNKARRAQRTVANTITRSNSISSDGIIKAHAAMNVLGLIQRQAHARNVNHEEDQLRVSHGTTAEAARVSLDMMRELRNRRRDDTSPQRTAHQTNLGKDTSIHSRLHHINATQNTVRHSTTQHDTAW